MKYCLGLPFSHTRALTDDERDLLIRCHRSARRRRYLTLAVGWISPPVILFGTAALFSGKSASDLPFWVEIVPMIAMFVLPAVTIMIAIDAKRKYRVLQKSVHSETLDVFTAGTDDDDEVDAEDELLLDENEKGAHTGLLQIPESGLILNTLASKSKLLYTAKAETAASPPERSVAGPALPRRVELKSDAVVPKRQLSPLELEDLKRLSARLTRVEWWRLLIFAYVTVGVCVLPFTYTSGFELARLGAYVVIDAFFIWEFSRRFKLRRDLKNDFRDGMVLEIAESDFRIEVLPFSQYVWTVDGLPSADRRVNEGVKQH